jgi:hypothetical protein
MANLDDHSTKVLVDRANNSIQFRFSHSGGISMAEILESHKPVTAIDSVDEPRQQFSQAAASLK